MKNLFFSISTFALLLLSSFSLAQTMPPQGVNYQAIARDSTGKPITSVIDLVVKFTILDSNSSTGVLTPVFSETHNPVKTNRYGLFTLVIGSENPTDFDTIKWAKGDKFLQVDIATGGASFSSMPKTHLMSVPYALHSQTSDYAMGNWSIQGNSGTSALTDFIGTKDPAGFVIRTNNLPRIIVKSDGNVGVGAIPASLFSVGTASQFQVNDTGAIVEATGITSSGPIIFSGLSSNGIVRTTGGTGTLSSGSSQINLTSEVSDSLPVANGGTGLTSFGNWQAFYSNGTGVLTPFTLGASGTVFQSNGNTSAPAWVAPSSLMQNLTNGTGINTFTYNGSSAVTVSIANTGIVGGSNPSTLSGQSLSIPNFSLNPQGQVTSVASSTVSVETPLTFSSGLTRTTNTVQLGGTLLQNTTISGGAFNTILDLTGTGNFNVIKNGGNSAFFIEPTSGNVGIGTATPAALLEVAGQVKITDGTEGTGKMLTSDASGLASWTTPAFGTVTTFSAGDLSPLFTTTETTITSTPVLSFALTNAAPYTILGNNTASPAVPTYFSPILASPLFQNQGSISTVLHGGAVAGPTWGQIVNADIANNTIDLANKVTGILSMSDGGSNANLTPTIGGVVYSTVSAMAILAPGSSGQVLTANNGAAPSWTTPTTGTVTSVGLALPGIFNVSNSPVTTAGTLTGSLASQNANLVFAGPSSGGNATPTFRALVAADFPGSFSGLANPSASIGLSTINGSATTAMRSDAAPALSQAIIPTWTGTHKFSNATYSALFTGGNVGIGTITPTYNLDVQAATASLRVASITAGNAANITVENDLGNAKVLQESSVGGTSFTGSTAYSAIYGTTHPYKLHLATNGIVRATIDKDGKVGIGTTAPVNILDVEGGISIGATYSGTNTAPANGAIIEGNVGIGTNSPAQKLDVAGTIQTTGFKLTTTPTLGYILTSDAAGVGTWQAASASWSLLGNATTTPSTSAIGTLIGAGQNYIGTSDAQDLVIGTSKLERMRILIDGKIGIGTKNPSYNLDVQGATGQLQVLSTTVGNIASLRATNDAGNAKFVVESSAGGGSFTGSTAYSAVFGTDYARSLHLATSSTVRATIDLNGNFGIGTTTPTALLHVSSNANSSQAVKITNLNAGTSASTQLSLYNDAGNYGGMVLGSSTYPSGANGLAIGTFGPGNVQLYANSAARLTIDYLTGNIGIGTASPLLKLDARGTNAKATTAAFENIFQVASTDAAGPLTLRIGIKTDATGGNRYGAINVDDAGSSRSLVLQPTGGNVGIGCVSPDYPLHVIGNVGVVGTIYATAASVSSGVNACSDIRYKKDVTPLKNVLSNVMKINGVNYFWKINEFPDKNFLKDKQIGFIAQELEKIYPEVVFTDKDGYKSVDYSRLTPVLVEAIKEQQKTIEAMQKQNEAQQKIIENIQSEIEILKKK